MSPQQRAEETRSRILQAAGESFARHGYDAASVSEICRRAGLSKGAFYHHFPSKQTLFLELLEAWLAGLERELDETHLIADNVPSSLLDMAGLAREIFRSAGGQFPIFLEFLTKALRDPAVWRATIAPYLQFRQFFTRIVAAGIAEGTLRPVDPDTAAQAIVSLAVGLLMQGMLDPQGADWGQVTEDSMRMLLQGIEKT